jgi:outer membrane protein insertion porin family
MNKKILVWASLICFSAAPMHTVTADSYSAEAYENKRVSKIDISMENLAPDSSFDPKPVLSKLKTKVGDPFSQMTFDTDLKALSEEYDRIEPYISINNDGIALSIKVWPRPQIRSIEWAGNSHMKTKTLRKELGIKSKTTFNRQNFNKAFNKLKEFYIKKGYFESQLQYSVVQDPRTNEVDIQVTIIEGRSGKIDDIVFKGFTSTEKSELLAMIYTKKYSLLTSWFSGSGNYNEEAIEQDKLTIINFLQNRGYADAKVDLTVKETASGGRIILEICAERGPIFHFGKITFDGNHLFTDEQIERLFISRPGGIYSPEKLRQTSDLIKDLYGRKGHIEAQVQYDTRLALNEPVYNVHFNIDEGEEYKIGIIRIFGNVQTESRVILRESLLIPGETFDSAKLKTTQMRLENIGYFKKVNVYAVRTQDDEALGDNYRDVYIEVDEASTGNVSLFFGFSTADDIFGGLELVESNFNYKGLGKLFSKGISAVRGGGEYFHAKASIGAKQRSYSLSWMNPYFRDSLWRVGFEANKSFSALQSKTYDINTYGLTLFASYPINPLWTFGLKYRIRDARVSTHGHHVSKEEKKEAKQDGLISASSVSLGFDSTDHPRKPHNGFRSLLEAEYAGIGGEFYFLRFGYLNSYYTGLWRSGIMKYRFDFKFIEPVFKTNTAEQIPLSERFFSGGETTVRGYKAFDLGPQFSNNGGPTGGISYSVLSVEFLQEIFSFLDGFVFADAGTVSQSRFNLDHYRLSCGYGARIDIAGRLPMIVGMGYPINPRKDDGEVRRFFFSMGGQF